MTFTISFGWWMLPFAVTILVTGWATLSAQRYFGDANDQYGVGALLGLSIIVFSIIPSLIAWLIWAVLT